MNKNDARAQLADNKRFRRKWITWTRMMRYGVNNFTRNLWLTTAATAVMTITLLIVFTTFVARSVLNDTVNDIRQKVDIPINLRSDVSDTVVKDLRHKLADLKSVSTVEFTTLEQAKNAYIDKFHPTAETLQVISELPTQPFYPTIKVIVKDPTDTSELESFVKNDQELKGALNPNPNLAPSFSGEKKKIISTISSWASVAEKGGLIAGVIFIAISMLIIFNTIRMAIFSRKDEIEMMKLIGADKGFIRGPFVVEALMYGFFAAIFATSIGISVFLTAEPSMKAYGVATADLHTILVMYSPVVLLIMMAIGAVIGIISSRLAVRRYLRL